MNSKKIFNNLQEKIALERFRVEAKKRRRNKRIVITLSTVAIIFAGILTANSIKEN